MANDYDPDQDDSNLSRTPITGCEFYPSVRDVRQVRKENGDVITQWRARPHPFGGGYCVARSINGKTDHLLSRIGCAPSILSFPSRGEAQVEADHLNTELRNPT